MILDIGIGVLAVVFTSFLFETDITTKLVVLSLVFALLPDIDVLWGAFLQNKGRWWERGIWGHREFTHYPLVHITISLLVYFIFGGAWAVIYLLSIFGHLIHDSIQDGWGIRWLWPSKNTPYELYIRRYGRNDWLVPKDWQLQGEYLGKRSNTNWIVKEYFGRVFKWEVLVLLASGVLFYFYAK